MRWVLTPQVQQTPGKRALDVSMEVGPAEAKEKAGLSLDGGRNVGDLLSVARCYARSRASDCASPGQGPRVEFHRLLSYCGCQPAATRIKPSFIHSFIQRAGTGPLLRLLLRLRLLPMPSTGGGPKWLRPSPAGKGLLCFTRQDSNCCVTCSKTEKQNRCFSTWGGGAGAIEGRAEGRAQGNPVPSGPVPTPGAGRGPGLPLLHLWAHVPAPGAAGRDQDLLFCTSGPLLHQGLAAGISTSSSAQATPGQTLVSGTQPQERPIRVARGRPMFPSPLLGDKGPLALRQWTPNTEAAQWAWRGAQATVHGHTAAWCRSSGGEVRITKVSVGKSMETPLRCH